MHYIAYLNGYQRVEVDAETYTQAQHNAATLLGTHRERDIYLIETPQRVSTADLIKDTEEGTSEAD
jgi:hypothetical protein